MKHELTPHHGLDAQSRSWSERVNPPSANDNEQESPVIIPLRGMVTVLAREEERCPQRQHEQHREAYAVANALIHKKIQELLPASAMLYVPADEVMRVMAELKQAVQHMVAEAHETASSHGKDFCRHTLTTVLDQKITSHLKHSSHAKNLQKRHHPHHVHPNCIAPETGMHTVAKIHVRYGGIDKNHGNYHGSCHP